MIAEVRRDRRVVGITAAMNSGTGLNLLQEAEPRHYFDVGIAEQQALLFASGLALEGLRPVAAIYSTFLQRAFDQIVHDVCLQELPVVLAMDRAGLVGDDGPTHHGVYDIAYLRCLPNMTLMAPRDEAEMVDQLRTALEHDGPTGIRYPARRGAGRAAAHRGPRAADRPAARSCARARASPCSATARASRWPPRPPSSCSSTTSRRPWPTPGSPSRSITGSCARSPTITSCSSPSRRGCWPAASAPPCGRAAEAQGISLPALRRVGVPDRYVTHGKPALLHREIGYTGRAVARTVAEALGLSGAAPARTTRA